MSPTGGGKEAGQGGGGGGGGSVRGPEINEKEKTEMHVSLDLTKGRRAVH